MDGILNGVSRFRCEVFPQQQSLYRRLVSDGQRPNTLVISCGRFARRSGAHYPERTG